MTFDEAISIVRAQRPKQLIWYGFDYKNEYIFAIAVDENYIPEDGALSWVSVDKVSSSVSDFDFWGRSIFQGEYALGKASENLTYVDVPHP